MAIVYVEPRPKSRDPGARITGYVVETAGDQLLHETSTQDAAIKWGKDAGHVTHVSRVRHLTDEKIPDHWRKA